MNGKGSNLLIIQGMFVGDRVIFPPGRAVLKVCFNPTEYSIEDRSVFAEASIPGLDSPIIQYSRGDAKVLSLELLLDTYAYGRGEDIRKKYIVKLEQLLAVDGELHAPPPCRVVWGSLDFVGVLESLNKRYVLFLDDGTPVRARVTLRWKEYIPVEIQVKGTPRSSPDRRKIHIIQEDDSLWQIAYRAYGDPKHWRLLAEVNDIDNPMRLEPGKEMVVPPLEKESGG